MRLCFRAWQTPSMKISRIALVTGAARGIGAATSIELAKQGCDLILCDLEVTSLAEIQKKVQSLGRKVWTYACDVGSHENTKALGEKIRTDCGRLDVLVNNAGITKDGLLVKMAEAQFDDVIRINLKGVFNVTQAVLPLLTGNPDKQAAIVNLASVAWMGNIGQTNYSAAKAGVVGMTATWALEFARFGVTSNAVAPGFIRTPMTEKVPPEIREKFVQKIPLKRMGEPEDIAALIAFLASPAARYITGQCIEIDGGLTVGISAI